MSEKLSNKVRAAIQVLDDEGFEMFTSAKLEDVIELKSGRRRRTYRNSGRYDLIIAKKKCPEVPEGMEKARQMQRDEERERQFDEAERQRAEVKAKEKTEVKKTAPPADPKPKKGKK